MRSSGSGGTGDTTGGSGMMGVPQGAGGYGREESDGSCRSLVIVRGRRPQKVVQEGLEALWVIDTPSVGSGGHS